MLKRSLKRDSYSSKNWIRSCDSCHTAPCTLYCYTDLAYLCQSCDECIHAANPLVSQHERVWVCASCENAPATITCQADAANLCIKCDTEIHLANPLACRHKRVPISPPLGIVPTSSTTYLDESQAPTEHEAVANKTIEELQQDEADSWLLLDLDNNDNQTNSGFTYGEDVDEYFDLIEVNLSTKYQCHDQNDQQQHSSVHREDSGSDSVVPVQSFESKDQRNQQQQNIFIDSGYAPSKAAFTNSTSSSHKVPVSYMSAGYLQTTSNIRNSYSRFSNGTNDLLPSPSLLMPLQLSPINREAKVLRYREKKKSRKFEKKIRYATRKANAESRPRVKGRFAKKDMEFEVDQMFSAEDYGYGIVPSYQIQ